VCVIINSDERCVVVYSVELESRIAALTSSSEAVLRRLDVGRVERSLRDTDLIDADNYYRTSVRRRPSPADDDDVDECRRCSQSARHRVCRPHTSTSGVAMGWAGWAKSRGAQCSPPPRVPGKNCSKNNFPLQWKLGHLNIKH